MKTPNRIGLGTAAIGRPQYINIRQNVARTPFSLNDFKEKAHAVFEAAYKLGIRHFDASPGYGMAETMLINWLREKKDPSIVVSTKWGYTYVANFDLRATIHEVKEHSIEKLNAQWTVSKQLLPYLKTYQVHSATMQSGVLDNVEVLKRLHRLKKEHQLNIGLSTTGDRQVDVLQKAMKITIEGEQLFHSFQCTFNILEQSVLHLKDKLERLEGVFMIKEALANGRLMPGSRYTNYQKVYDFLTILAKKHKVSPDAIALRYCMDCFPKALVLSGTSDLNHLKSNVQVNQFMLSPSEIKQLNSYSVDSIGYWNERKRLPWQ